MARTTQEAVRAIIATDDNLSVLPFIETATTLVDWLDSCDTSNELSDSALEVIERYLAAHFYAHRDQLYSEKKVGKSSGKFQGQTAMVLSSTQYGQTAMLLDVTGCLARRSKQAEKGTTSPNMAWLGKASTT